MKLLALAVFLALLIIPCVALTEEFNTIEELSNAFSDDKCGTCHLRVYEEWLATPHADSMNLSLGGMRNFLVFGVKGWWGREITKDEVMKCLDCHAPLMHFAAEGLALKVADMIVAAKETKDEKKRESIKKELARLNVGCVSCHNIKATAIAPGRLGEPEKGAVYGIEGKPSPAHKTIKSAELGTALYCMQCHGNYTAPDGEVIKCNTLNGSYQDGYVARGGSRTCQDCHMRAKNRGHGMLGGRDLELVREGIGFTVEVSQYLHLPGKGEKLWTPSALVNVELENRAGHRIPDG
jgi:hypothetical protein